MENKTLCGLSWPERGYPSYFCVLREKHGSEDKTFDRDDPVIEIVKEGQIDDYFVLKELKTLRCSQVYTYLDSKYFSFIRDFNRFKREENLAVRLIQSDASSYEAAVLKIKTYIKSKKLVFPPESLIKSQLTVFSKETLLDPIPAYAVRSLCMVIGQFKNKINHISQEEKNPKLWW